MHTESKKISTDDQLERAHRGLSVIYNINTVLRTTLELKHILYIILTGVTSHTGLGFNRAVLFLVDKNNRFLEPKMAIGPESGEDADQIWKHIKRSNQNLEDLSSKDKISSHSDTSKLYQSVKGLKIPLNPDDNNLLTTAYYKNSPVIIKKEEIEKYTDDPLLKVFHTKELIIVPLRAKENVNGLIIADNIYTQKSISNDDIKIFSLLSSQAGLAIENSQLFEIAVQKSHKDSLTDLWNHGYFQDTLLKELKKAQNKNEKLSLLMIDIDNFKLLNDTYGHQNGDTVIRELASILKDSFREMDYICRYGGEEFSIILTKANREKAFDIAERMREAIMSHTFVNFNPDHNIKVTVSIGLATFPDDAGDHEELIEKADRSMYIAKMGGKNQTIIYDNDV